MDVLSSGTIYIYIWFMGGDSNSLTTGKSPGPNTLDTEC